MKKLCIYHGNCADGFTSAWVLRNALGEENVDFYAGVYQEDPPDCTGREVFIVDFSYKRPVMDKIIEQASNVTILDHHKSAAEDLKGIFDPVDCPDRKVEGIFDMNHSGAMLAWLWFNDAGTENPPWIVRQVEDRDLWRFELFGTREIQANIFSYEYTFENWDKISTQLEDEQGIESFMSEGRAIERKHHKDVAELVAVCKRRMLIGDHDVPVASLPYTLTSDAGHLMAQDEPFAACYWDTPEGRVFSLRSTEDGIDVSAIASMYGGGGHKNASGFRVAYSDLASDGSPHYQG